MAYRKRTHEHYPLPSDPDYWVELRRLSLLDTQAVQRNQYGAVRASLGGGINEIAMRDLDGPAAILTIMRAAVSAWNLDEELPDGTVKPLPITDETLKELEPEDMEFIVHTAVRGTSLEPMFGRASISVAEDSPNGAPLPDEVDSLFTAGPSRP